jgi:predicted PurR-regulated permease PerM
VGTNVTFNDIAYAVVGILPQEFEFVAKASDFQGRSQFDVWVPLALNTAAAQRGTHPLRVFARLKPGTDLGNAQADLDIVAANLARGTLATVGRFFATMVILFFLLAAGDRLLRGFIDILPRFSDKQQAVEIAFEIQRNIGGYLITITVMNCLVGIATALAMWSTGLGDPILWGAMAFLLNYIPILGPLTGIGIFLIAGILALEWPLFALLPAALYTLIHVAEGELITPMLLAKRFTLNPVIVIVSLFFWHALWGIPGALLAVPVLAMFKIVADRIEPLKPMGHVIGA